MSYFTTVQTVCQRGVFIKATREPICSVVEEVEPGMDYAFETELLLGTNLSIKRRLVHEGDNARGGFADV